MPISTIPAAGLSSGVPTRAQLPAGSVLQVVQTVKTSTFTTSSTSFTDVTGLSVSITPTSASNKILVLCYAVLSNTNTGGNYYSFARLMRDATPIFVGDAAGSRLQASYSNTAPIVQFLKLLAFRI